MRIAAQSESVRVLFINLGTKKEGSMPSFFLMAPRVKDSVGDTAKRLNIVLRVVCIKNKE